MNKKFYLFFAILFFTLSNTKAQNIDFAYTAFKKYLLSSSPDNYIAKDSQGKSISIDTNGDGEISYEEALKVFSLEINGFELRDESLYPLQNTTTEELKYFSNIEIFSASGVKNPSSYPIYDLSGLDKLKEVYVEEGYKAYMLQVKFPDSMPNLKVLHYSLGISDFSKTPLIEDLAMLNPTIENVCTLKKLKVGGANISLKNLPNLTDLEFGMTTGREFSKEQENLNIIYLENLPNLTEVLINNKDYVSMEGITIKNMPNLKNINLESGAYGESPNPILNLGFIKLEKLPVLVKLNLAGILLPEVNTSELPALEYLDCNYNYSLKSLDLSENTKLKKVIIGYSDYLDSLDLSKNIELTNLTLNHMYKNQWEILDLTHNKNLDSLRINLSNIKIIDLRNSPRMAYYMNYGGENEQLLIKNNIYDSWLNSQDANYKIGSPQYICADEVELEKLRSFKFSGGITPLINSDCKPYKKDEGGKEDENEKEGEKKDENEKNEDKEQSLSIPSTVSLYPNPVRDVLFINTQQKVQTIEIYDINGRLVSTQSIKDNHVNVSFLPKGYYIAVVTTSLGKEKQKFIKQ